MDPKMQTKNVDFFYGSKQCLKKVSLDIKEYSTTALMGPSGCGKSTFLRTLNHMNDIVPKAHLKGQVLLDGSDIYAPETDIVEVRKRVGMVFQQPNPLPRSIFENTAFGPRMLGTNHRSSLEEIVKKTSR